MNQDEPQFLDVGAGPRRRRIAFRRRAPARDGLPGVVWLGGFKSDMDSTKATALDAHCAERGQALAALRLFRPRRVGRPVRGRRRFRAGSRKRSPRSARETSGRQVLVGSSMGGYLALLVARALARRRRERRASPAWSSIAPAVDFTEALMWARASEAERRAIVEKGVWERPSAYSARALPHHPRSDRGRAAPPAARRRPCAAIARCGSCRACSDEDVPYRHALTLVEHMAGDPVDADADQGRRPSAVAPAGSRVAARSDRRLRLRRLQPAARAEAVQTGAVDAAATPRRVRSRERAGASTSRTSANGSCGRYARLRARRDSRECPAARESSRQEKLSPPVDEHEPQRLAVSRKAMRRGATPSRLA